MTRGTKCRECGKPIGPEEIAIHIPEDCDKDVGNCGWFHRDCGIFHEMGEDGFLLAENIERVFAVITDCLTDWSIPEDVMDDKMPRVEKEMGKLRCAVYDYLEQYPDMDPPEVEEPL